MVGDSEREIAEGDYRMSERGMEERDGCMEREREREGEREGERERGGVRGL